MLFEKRRVKELVEDKRQYDVEMSKAQKEVKEFRQKLQKEVKMLRERSGRLTEENLAFKKVIDDMRVFFNKMNAD